MFTIIKSWNFLCYSFKEWRIQIFDQICSKANSSMKKNQLNMNFVKKKILYSELLSQNFFKSAKILGIYFHTIWKPLYGSAWKYIVFHLYMKYLENICLCCSCSEKMEKFIQENIIFLISSFQLFFVVFLSLIHDMYLIFYFLMAVKVFKIDFYSNLT